MIRIFTPPFTVQRLADFVSRQLMTYKKGMEALLGGYREVTINKSTFKFEDNTTAEERIKKFEERLQAMNFQG
jgi:predicted deacetylase